jgi:monoterpene epsilon-lactone hydrolase
MRPTILKDSATKTPWSVIHPLSEEDSVAVGALRSVVAPMKGKLEGIAGRGLFNDIMERVAVPEAAIIHVHGGWFNWGTARRSGTSPDTSL